MQGGEGRHQFQGNFRGDGHQDLVEVSRFASDRPLAVEAPFELPIGEAVVRGRIDAVYGTDDHWEVVDFKSGRPSDDPAVDLQLDAYAVAVAAGALGPALQSVGISEGYYLFYAAPYVLTLGVLIATSSPTRGPLGTAVKRGGYNLLSR